MEPEEPAPIRSCGELPVERALFGCVLVWGANGNRSDRASYLGFITTWVGYEAGGRLGSDACDGCKLVQNLTSQKAMAVYHAYFTGYQASAAGFGDCNLDHDGQNLRGPAGLPRPARRPRQSCTNVCVAAQRLRGGRGSAPYLWLRHKNC
ncbi:MAG TPA: hypothetical protein VJN18_28200 [Polyangiaceae bacterium]|nr:hypothetical protein [Polyangiaceae bacterium]